MYKFLIAILLFFGLWFFCLTYLFKDSSFVGTKQLRRISTWRSGVKDFWQAPILKELVKFASRFVYMDATEENILERQLFRAGINISAKEFVARKFLILFLGVILVGVSVLLKCYIIIPFWALVIMYLIARQRELLSETLQMRNEEIEAEMPRFVRIVCRTLMNNRDIYSAVKSYRKVAGPTLGKEIDILLLQMQSGNIAQALNEFQVRIGTKEAFRFCSALLEIDRGTDQLATLNYLADDMARISKLTIQKKLALRPRKMKATYMPAICVCIFMILYVLVVYVKDLLNSMI